jgi:hypothetical protein
MGAQSFVTQGAGTGGVEMARVKQDDSIKVGDRVRITFALIEELVVREILRGKAPGFDVRTARLAEVWRHDDFVELAFTNTDEDGKPLPGWASGGQDVE